jgi:hypothetical protein
MWLKFIFFRQQRRVEKTMGTDTFSSEADVCFLKSFFSQGTEAPKLVMMCEVFSGNSLQPSGISFKIKYCGII